MIDPLPQRSQRSAQPGQSAEVPDIKNIVSLRPGSKGRNFESFTGLKQDTVDIDSQDSKKVLVKLYKRQ